MRYTVPVEDFLLLLRSNAIVLVKEVKERTFRLLQRGIGAGFQVAQVRENALLEFLRVFHGPAEGLESKGETSHDVCSGNVKKIIPVQLSAGEAGGWTAVSSNPQLVSLHTIAHRIRIRRSVVGICEYIDLAASLPELR